MLHGQQNIKKW